MRNVFVTELVAGLYFGETSLVSEVPRTATVTAKEKTTMLLLKKKDFQSFLNLVPDMKRDIEMMVRQRSAQSLRALKVQQRSVVWISAGCCYERAAAMAFWTVDVAS